MNIFENFAKLKILVVGDVMVDRYWWGEVSRISPEAPVPVVRLKRSSIAAGGAANVAANVAGLGAQPILVGIVGSDDEGRFFPSVLEDVNVRADFLLTVPHRPTTVKTRVIAHSQQVARIDQEDLSAVLPETEDAIIEKLSSTISDVDAVAVSDYGKGMLTDRVLKELFGLAANLSTPVLVDPKGKTYLKYRGASLITPNRREAAEACMLEEHLDNVVNRAGGDLMANLNLPAVLITQGEEGMTLFQKDHEAIYMPAVARDVYDVTGAGDTVLATLAVSISAGFGLADAARLANVAAGLVVEQVGTTRVSAEELDAARIRFDSTSSTT